MNPSKQRKIIKLEGQEGYKIEDIGETEIKKTKAPFLQATEIGFTIALPLVAGALFGLWLDEKFDSHPKLTLSFLFVGIFLAFGNLFVIVKKIAQKKK